MAAESFARLAEHRGDTRRLAHLRHVTGRTAFRMAERTVPPLEKRYLLGQRTKDLTGGADRLRVERVAGRAQLGLADVRRFGGLRAARRMHDARQAGFDRERAV